MNTYCKAKAHERLSILASIVALALFALPVQAQVTVDRMEVEFAAAPTAQTEIVRAINATTESIQADILVEDWSRTEYGENVWAERGSNPHSCADRISVFPESILLEPGEETELRLTMEPGPDTAECWSAVMIETSRTGKDGNLYILRTAVKVYGMPAAAELSGVVEDVRILQYAQWFGEMADRMGRALTPEQRELAAGNDSLLVEVVFDNAGSRHVRGEGRVEFRRPDGEVETTVTIPNLYVLPGARRRATATLPQLRPGQYAVLAIVDFGGADLTAMQMEYHVE